MIIMVRAKTLVFSVLHFDQVCFAKFSCIIFFLGVKTIKGEKHAQPVCIRLDPKNY